MLMRQTARKSCVINFESHRETPNHSESKLGSYKDKQLFTSVPPSSPCQGSVIPEHEYLTPYYVQGVPDSIKSVNLFFSHLKGNGCFPTNLVKSPGESKHSLFQVPHG